MFPGISFWMVYFDDSSITRLTDDLGKSFRDRDSPGWSMSTCYVIRFADFVGEDGFNACLLDVHVILACHQDEYCSTSVAATSCWFSDFNDSWAGTTSRSCQNSFYFKNVIEPSQHQHCKKRKCTYHLLQYGTEIISTEYVLFSHM